MHGSVEKGFHDHKWGQMEIDEASIFCQCRNTSDPQGESLVDRCLVNPSTGGLLLMSSDMFADDWLEKEENVSL